MWIPIAFLVVLFGALILCWFFLRKKRQKDAEALGDGELLEEDEELEATSDELPTEAPGQPPFGGSVFPTIG